MNHKQIKKLITQLYELVDERRYISVYGDFTYCFTFIARGKKYEASVYEEKARVNSYLISNDEKFITATMNYKTFERDLRELGQ